ncbi:MAG: glycosyltransferase family 2 protein [Flavobacteriaceae bacterium]|nr:glycosyltransferase family 2 protein [Flavobacteriaceae bacterium]
MISIIIPVYNRAHLIEATLKSIINQTFKEWECIIIDDESTDNTLEVIEGFCKKDSRFKCYNRPKALKKGPSACRNYGFSLSKGKYIQFFDSDDIMQENHLFYKWEKLELGHHDFVSCNVKRINLEIETPDFNQSKEIDIPKDVFKAFVKGEFPLMMMAPIWRKDFIKSYLPMREDMNMLEDHELYARVLKNVRKYKHINKTLILLRGGHSSLTQNFFKNADLGVMSFLEASKTVINLAPNEKDIILFQLKKVLWLFRLSIAQKKYKSADLCLKFLKQNTNGLVLKLKLKRISIFYRVLRLFGKGDTFFKPFLKL